MILIEMSFLFKAYLTNMFFDELKYFCSTPFLRVIGLPRVSGDLLH